MMGCEFCALDAAVGVSHEVCPHRIEVQTGQGADGKWYARANLNDGEPNLITGPFETVAEARAAADSFVAAALKALGPRFKASLLS